MGRLLLSSGKVIATGLGLLGGGGVAGTGGGWLGLGVHVDGRRGYAGGAGPPGAGLCLGCSGSDLCASS